MIPSTVYATVPLLEDPELLPIDHLVWMRLCAHARWIWENGKPIRTERGSCFPSRMCLAQEIRCSLPSVKRSLDRLEATGHVVCEKRFRESDGAQTSNDYTLIVSFDDTSLPPSDRAGGDHTAGGGLDDSTADPSPVPGHPETGNGGD